MADVAFTTERAEDFDTTNQSTAYTIGGAFTPNANSLLICVIVAVDNAGTFGVNAPTHGTAWTQVPNTNIEGTNGSAFVDHSVWYFEVGGSPSSMTVTCTPTEATTGLIGWIGEFSNHKVGAPVKNGNTASSSSGTPNISVAGGSADSNSMVVAIVSNDRTPGGFTAEDVGWTRHTSDTALANPTTAVGIWTKVGDPTFTATGTVDAIFQSIFEIDSADETSVNANGASTLTALTQSAEGDLIVAATGASSMSALTQAAEGDTIVAATGAQTLSALTQAGTGTVGDPELNATGASTLEGLTQAAEGDTIVAGTGASTLTGLTQAAEGDVLAQGTGASSLTGLTQAAEGDNLVQATGASTLSSLTQAAEADALAGATAASTIGALEQAAVGAGIVSATGASTLSSLTQAATGTNGEAPISATGASTLEGLTQAATATLTVSAIGASALSGLEQAASAENIEPAALEWAQRTAAGWTQDEAGVWTQDHASGWTQTTTPPTWD